MQDERAQLKAAGFSDAEIADYLKANAKPAAPARQGTPSRSFAAESTAQRGTVSAPKTGALSTALLGYTRAGAQGATFGFADEAEAGVRSLGGGSYKQIRDRVRAENDAFSDANPVSALAANLLGGVLTGGAALKAAQGAAKLATAARVVAPRLSATATTSAKVGQAARAGAGAGALAGAGAAKETEDLGESMAVGGLLGGVLGGAAAGAGTVVRGARNVASRIGQGQRDPGPIRRAIRADSPEDGAVKRVAGLLGNQKMSVDELAARSAAADAPDTVAEVIGARGIRSVRTARTLGYEAPDMIESTLERRARDDVGRVRGVVRDELGEQLDEEALKTAKLAEARETAPLFDEALDGVTIEDPRVVDMLKRPIVARAYGTAQKMAANDGEVMPDIRSIFKGAKRGSTLDVDDLDDVAEAAAPSRAPVPLPEDGIPSNLSTLSDDDLERALERVAAARETDMLDAQLIPDYVRTAVEEEGAVGMSAARQAARRDAARGRGLNAKEVKAEGGALSEEMVSAIENAGYDVAEWIAARQTMAQGAFRLKAREQAMARLTAEAERRAAEVGESAVTGTGAKRFNAEALRRFSVPDESMAPELPRISGRQLQYVKHAIDDDIIGMEGKAGGTSTKRYAQLLKARSDVDALLYEFSNPAEDGASLWGQANRGFAKPMQQADAFKSGVRAGRSVQPPDVSRLLADPESEYVAKGVANTLQDDLARLGDGAAGPVRDPGPTLMGSDAARARLTVAARGDAGRVERVERAASNTSRRLKNRQTIVGGSQTADKLADQSEAALSPSDVLAAVANPKGGLLKAAASGVNALQRNIVGQDMDAVAKLLMAGAPGQMTRDEMIAYLRTALPKLVQAQRPGALARGLIATQAGQRAPQ